MKEEGLDPRASEEPRFTFVKDISSVDPGFKPPEKDASLYDFRLIFSYFADYGEPLGDPEIGSFPEGFLQKLVDRCRKYGIRVFLHMNEPRGQSPEFFKVSGI